MPIAEISAALTSINVGKALLSGLVATRDTVKLNEVKIGLQSAMLDAQQALFSAQQDEAAHADRVADLEQEIVRLKDWSTEKERYELVAPSEGAFVYMQKSGMRTTEPAHWLCAPCFGNAKKSILQRVTDREVRPRERQWVCPTCKAQITAFYSRTPAYEEVV